MDRSKCRTVCAEGLVEFGLFRELRSNRINIRIGRVVIKMQLVTSADKDAEKMAADGDLLRWVQS